MKHIGKTLLILSIFSGFLFSTALRGNGGILPYVIHKDSIYFLLSRETSPSGIDRWSDFIGIRNRTETPAQTAAKEGSQELMNVMGYNYLLKKITNTQLRCGNTFIINISDQGRRREIIDKLNIARRRPSQRRRGYLKKNEFRWFSRGRLIKAIQQNEWWLERDFKNRFRKCIPILHKI